MSVPVAVVPVPTPVKPGPDTVRIEQPRAAPPGCGPGGFTLPSPSRLPGFLPRSLPGIGNRAKQG
ncbi:hypothetical protein Ait01nite_015970 [Actinoplanes italicus]|uniref:Uncharacterized protein n=1 Tax=Actinoplanes italicus TaxID=113567 RepID=A0A2T0KHW4_9ACTN|nr:hypothetical protein CLV67_104561 [Actinoplanes italicus]GIE28552.1 hypothetical protein Ait01nite_015970 [Actinoplanes italicus]